MSFSMMNNSTNRSGIVFYFHSDGYLYIDMTEGIEYSKNSIKRNIVLTVIIPNLSNDTTDKVRKLKKHELSIYIFVLILRFIEKSEKNAL